MKKLSSLSLFLALAGLALMPTADSFASYKDSCSGCEVIKIPGDNVLVTCSACKKADALSALPSFVPGANKGKTRITCFAEALVHNCDGQLRCGPCTIDCGSEKMNVCNGQTTCGPCKGTP